MTSAPILIDHDHGRIVGALEIEEQRVKLLVSGMHLCPGWKEGEGGRVELVEVSLVADRQDVCRGGTVISAEERKKAGKFDYDKIREAAFRCRIQQWMDEYCREITIEAYAELKEIMKDEDFKDPK